MRLNAWPELAKLRIGCVQYLNARPLIHGYDGPVIFDHPSALARDIASGALDVALVPIFEALGTRRYLLADGVGICSDGPVYSVFLAHRIPLAKVRAIALDPASLTSVNLLKVLLGEFYDLRPNYIDASTVGGDPDAQLLIGNQAIHFRRRASLDWRFLDLGEEWKLRTGLPFVYAPWLMRADLPQAKRAADELRALGDAGVACIPEIVAQETLEDAEFRMRYLTEHIRFSIGERERAGIVKFQELLARHGLVPPSREALIFV